MKNESFFTGKKIIVLFALTASLLWGSAFPAIKSGYILFDIAAGDVPAKLIFAGYRFTLAGILLLIFAIATGKKVMDLKRSDFIRLGILGLAMTALQYTFFYIGLANTTGVKGAIINSTATFFSVILAHFIYRNDRLNKYTVTGCLLGFIGVLAVSWNPEGMDWQFRITGEGFLVIAAFFLAAAGIYGKIISQTVDSTVMTGWQLFIGGVVLTVSGCATGGELTHFTPAGTALLIYMAFLSSTAFALYAILMKHNPVSRITVFNFTTPIFGAILSALVLGEKILEWKNLFALLMVCAGIWLVNSRFKRKA